MNNMLSHLLFLLQLEEYDIGRFLAWTKTHDSTQIKQEKKQLVWTIKAKVIYVFASVLVWLGIKPISSLILTTKVLLWPENIIRTLIIELAKIKLRTNNNLIIIGITGSFGKTSVKEILSHILSTQYQVLKTPESYNTPLGIAKIILKDLQSKHQIFIVEMGAYQIGDIKKLCDFVHPKIGILTAIGKQHLERFGNQENIIKAKGELLESLPNDSLAVINGDNTFCLKIAQKLKINKIAYGLNTGLNLKLKIENLKFLVAFNVKSNQTGSSFKIKTDRGVLTFQTRLLGTHNIENILAGISVARELNISWEKIQTTIPQLPQIPHRLQIISGTNNTTIIDDAYNANPDSVKAALTVLKDFPSPRKIVVTPGLVELGKEQDKENEMMGQEISKVADYLIIVGNTNKETLKKGFVSTKPTHYDTVQYHSRVIECHDLDEATKKLQEIIIPKSVILFENDLPDQYV